MSEQFLFTLGIRTVRNVSIPGPENNLYEELTLSRVTSGRRKVAKDEAGKANGDLKGQTLSKWDLLLNAMGASERFSEGVGWGNHFFCLKTGG